MLQENHKVYLEITVIISTLNAMCELRWGKKYISVFGIAYAKI